MKTSLLKWIKQDLDNQFKIDAGHWELDHKITYLDLEANKVGVNINLYVNVAAFLEGKSPIKVRSYVLNIDIDGIKDMFLGAIKGGVEAITDTVVVDIETLETQEVAGFFNQE